MFGAQIHRLSHDVGTRPARRRDDIPLKNRSVKNMVHIIMFNTVKYGIYILLNLGYGVLSKFGNIT